MPRWFSRNKEKAANAMPRIMTSFQKQEAEVDASVEAGLFPARVASRNGAKLLQFSAKIALLSVILVMVLSYFGLIDPIRNLLGPIQIGGTGTLIVSSDYTRTQIYLDGKVVGQTPFTGENIDAGRHKLKVQAAENANGFFKEAAIDIEVFPGNATIVKANVAPETSLFSYSVIASSNRKDGDSLLVVKALPGEVKVRVDGTIVGTAPFVSDTLSSGAHQLLLEKEGYKPVLIDITISADKQVTVETQLYQYQINLDR
ncbi:hypothetical protein CO112_00915 [Candidatus Dojkabacteria bacterium CG_4_9_14_3_um_filter_150_Dojkabacteria_WS6_41_13]|uniref:PEGA domain-containing protein n=2 Tax=Bacteria candidate phyla TaxID=1783234 RepID=A0A2M7W2W6_9BACT|nr:MAG: hypothetical protein COZ14_01110 [Candidatus Dojkabacteria bacterium CG_4_10_14_3_um_filter_Dojkabacteria_WS6_41_9]PIZ10940.1 MAG: hypothetical protein COY54_00910 [Candidatus Falkowbacteria bacterium CG_4_10_14_0_8_um_filter_41_36]PJA15019.1 MAG: hypothetical protein COX64_01360 [Candidatus Dojkabacteria bacterium CG_4_10_14_0_2_um_filter_Dojkabacteria_WS6_41_15]PJB23453.1 MAG: hypothetical protein CO112_00915 [Candidatus Dojkabacteria bacterium CG_4_9_14_3_um_filter_150_Dojkabacteria_W